ncbi:MAG TPA: DHA2 family efflux MFS transporter permease subunit [Alphaproteobacteria bacterium]|nr:DHA2 family efflux MFS transporter permease subunit [Alphaproteobacteria bacterium]
MTAAAIGRVDVRQKIGFVAMIFGMFMAILDIQIVSSSIAQIQAGVAASADEITWVQTAYLIAEIVMIPLSGLLARALSTRMLFVISCAGFTAMSFLCAEATNMDQMILFRVLQGFLGGAMIPTVFATGFRLFPGNQVITVVIGLVATCAPTVGPTIGGYLTETYSWHWLFLINVLPGVAVTALVWLLIDIDRPEYRILRTIEPIGLISMAVFLGGLEYVLDEGPRWDWFEDGSVRLIASASAIGAAIFFWRTLTSDRPVVELRAFLNRNFLLGSLLQFVLGIGLYGATYITPLFLGRVRGYNALEIGNTMFIGGLSMLFAAPVAGALSSKFDPRAVIAGGFGLAALGLYLNSILTADSAFWELFLPQAVRGVGFMLSMVPVTNLALGTLSPEQLNNASGLFNLMRNLGGAIGLAGINTVLTDRLAVHLSRLSDHLSLARTQVQAFVDRTSDRLGGQIAGDGTMAAIRQLSAILNREATILTFSDCLIVMAACFAVALVLIPLVAKPKVGGASIAAH